MKKIIIALLLLINSLYALDNSYYSSDFINTVYNAKSAALGKSGVCLNASATSLFYNPAMLSLQENSSATFFHYSLFQNIAYTDILALSFKIDSTNGIGLSLTRNTVDNILDTRGLSLNEKQVPIYEKEKIKNSTASDNIVFVGYGTRVLPKLYAGLTFKMFYRNLVSANGYGVSADMALAYIPKKNIKFAVKVSDFSTVFTHWSTGTNETGYPKISLGSSYEKNIQYFYGKVTTYFQMDVPTKYNGVITNYSDSIITQFNYKDPLMWIKQCYGGLDYNIKNVFSLRAGVNPDYKYTFGAGIHINSEILSNALLKNTFNKLRIISADIDYAFLDNSQLYGSHLISVSVDF